MALLDFDELKEPVTVESPCGVDLDVDGDPDYMNLMARIEGLLPESYFTFERSSIDFKAETEALRRLLNETRDLRILAFLAKLFVLDRDLGSFSRCVAAIADLLEDRWDSVHPVIGDADAGMRSAILQTLDDLPNVIIPLQYMPLAKGRRSGAISFRTQMIITGEVARREQDPGQDATAVEQALTEGDLPDLVVTRDHAARLHAAVGRIHSTWIAHAGFADSPSLDRLSQLSEKIVAFLDMAVARRDPTAALHGGAEGEGSASADANAGAADSDHAPGARPQIRSAGEAAEALAGVGRFLAQHEPSNPALLLVRQAEQLVGKTFIEIMTILVPDVVSDARINVGHDQPVAFPIERLSSVMPERTSEDEEDAAAVRPDGQVPITTRFEAMARLDQVSSFYRVAEPSSPIPLLMDRARSFASRDFMSLLREFSPDRR